MNLKSAQCCVTTLISEDEKRLFVTMAHEWGIPSNALMRRLLQYFLDEKISWNNLFGQRGETPAIEGASGSGKKQVRTVLTPEQYSAFARRVEECGSTTAIVTRRLLLLYIAGKIERGAIWY
jgi:hypothetical protein